MQRATPIFAFGLCLFSVPVAWAQQPNPETKPAPAPAQPPVVPPPPAEKAPVDPNAPNPPVVEAKSQIKPLNPVELVVEVPATYATIRETRTLRPRSYLLVQVGKLEASRFRLVHPEEPQVIVRRTPAATTGSSSLLSEGINEATKVGQGEITKKLDDKVSGLNSGTGAPVPAVTNAAPAAQALIPNTVDEKRAIPTAPKELPVDKVLNMGGKPVTIAKVERTGNVARLTLDGVETGDKLGVAVVDVEELLSDDLARPVALRVSTPVTVTETTRTVFRPDLIFAANQRLTDGTSKSVIQFPLRYEVPTAGTIGGSNLYFRSDSLLSSSSKDASTRINLTAGLERDLDGTPLPGALGLSKKTGVLPGRIETRLDANQQFSNLVFTIDAGLRKRIGPGRDPQWEANLNPRNSNILGLSTFFEQRLKRDTTATPQHAGTTNLGFTGSFDAAPFKLFALPGAAGKIELVGGLQGWWLPFEKGANGVSPRTTEYLVRAGIQIPLPKLLGADRRLRIEYVDGANPASGFFRARSLQFEVVGPKF